MNHLPSLPHGHLATTKVYASASWTAMMYHYAGKVGPVLHVTDVKRFGHNELYLVNGTALEIGASFLEWGDNQLELTELFDELNEELRL